jgi:hypothetical protein
MNLGNMTGISTGHTVIICINIPYHASWLHCIIFRPLPEGLPIIVASPDWALSGGWRIAAAIEAYDKAIELIPDNPMVWTSKGVCS